MDVEGAAIEWPMFPRGVTVRDKSIWERRWEIIAPLYQEGKYDHEIAAELGVSVNAVADTRRYAGKPANMRADRYLWHDQEAQQRHAAQMVTHRKGVGRGKKASFR